MSLDPIGKLPYNTSVEYGDTSQIDAFGRLRVSEMTPIFDSKQIFDNQALFFDDQQISGSGTTSTHSVNKSSTTLAVSTATGTRVRQTFQSFNYQPGKSFLIMVSLNLRLSGGGANITARAGYFNDKNGIFLENASGTYAVVQRGYMTGAAVDTRITQANWNVDKMDGTGPSGATLDFTKSQIFTIDMEWLGVGRARVGFYINGRFHVCHEFRNANAISGVYMSSPNLPVRFSISNNGGGAASSMEVICCSVSSEGNLTKTGVERHFASEETSNINAGSNRALLGFRLKSARAGAVIELIKLTVIGSGNGDKGAWRLTLNPTVSGTALSYTGQTNSSLEIASAANNTTISGGTVIGGGFFTDGGAGIASNLNTLRLGEKIDGTRDILVLSCVPITNNINVQGSVTWLELT